MKCHVIDLLSISSLVAFMHALLSHVYLCVSQAFLYCICLSLDIVYFFIIIEMSCVCACVRVCVCVGNMSPDHTEQKTAEGTQSASLSTRESRLYAGESSVV